MSQESDVSRPSGSPQPLPQPMGIGSVLEIAVRILRRHWAVLLGIALLLVGPAALLTAATAVRLNDVLRNIFPGLSEGVIDDSISLTNAQLERLGGAFAVYLAATTFAGVLATIAALGFSAVVAADYHHRSLELRDALRVCLRRALSALGVIVVTTLIIVTLLSAGLALILLAVALLPVGTGGGGPGTFVALIIGVALVVAVLYLTMRWAFALPVLAIEDEGWRRGLRRSWHLSGDNVWRTVVVALLAALITALLGALIAQLLAVVLVDVLAVSLGLDLSIAESLSLALGTILLAPLAPVLMAVLYFDLRARRDPPPPPAPAVPSETARP